MSGSDQGSPGFEIERKWKLHRLPDRLLHANNQGGGGGVECLWMQQGYLPPAKDADFTIFAEASPDDVPRIGRIRSMEARAGGAATRFVHTIKSGSGLIRREQERDISQAAFEAAWPETRGRRIQKTRWRIPESGVIWEVDLFEGESDLGLQDGGLVLLEAEAADPEQARRLQLPPWLAEVVDREVTEDPAFTNAEIAFRMGLG